MKDGYEKSAGHRLQRAARLQRVLAARHLTRLGLFPGQETVLKLLATQDGRTMTELATALGVRPPTASKTVGRLSAQGLLSRQAAEADGRLVRVYLTDEGRARAGAIDAILDGLEETAVSGLDGKDRRRLRKLLRRVERNLATELGGTPEAPDDEPVLDEDAA
ncbi:MAG TPA: MarR family transcriptional regulator [Xanthobacteraceae bacterium]|nr:MarR family transcriptional regulator [Xanthobacteraceae bacterium]